MKSTNGSVDRPPHHPRRPQKSTAVDRKGHLGRCFSCGKYGHKARSCRSTHARPHQAPSSGVVNVHNYYFNGNVNGSSLSLGGPAMLSAASPSRAFVPTTTARIATTAVPTTAIASRAEKKKQKDIKLEMEEADEEIVRWTHQSRGHNKVLH
ncbi:hypothetical protein BJ166DRAFT_261797 [Pestalotiopsis sp. NC0098]|nr:hypothetical protein BJ166DRAFT_261797 [Pestalotiopsis sp. NC0098]